VVESDAARPLDVVFVCTGNRFRSPLAAASFAAAAARASVPVRVRSFGTLDVGGASPLAIAVDEAARAGLDLTAHRPQALPSGGLADVDAVVGFERMHVVSAVVEGGARRELAFTLPELRELLRAAASEVPAAPVEHAREVLARVGSSRGDLARWTPAEVDDPIGRHEAEQRQIAARVQALVNAVAATLFRAGTAAGERT
jgi:protein-tyrosine phosphatase